MNRYRVTKKIGDGTYGVVLKAVNRSSGEVVRCRESGWLPWRRQRAAARLAGGHQANEEEVLLVGGVHAAA